MKVLYIPPGVQVAFYILENEKRTFVFYTGNFYKGVGYLLNYLFKALLRVFKNNKQARASENLTTYFKGTESKRN